MSDRARGGAARGREASLAEQYRLNETNLGLRRQMLGFGPADVKVLRGLAGWAGRVAGPLAKEFYDHQFAFAPTRDFFADQASRRGVSLAQLREHLERAQAGYFREIFQEAAQGGQYGPSYFEKRLKVGKLHNVINLPFKWYIGSYGLYQDLVRKYLARSFWFNPFLCKRAERAIFQVFLYDVQAVADAFFYDYLESIGLDLDRVSVSRPEHDLSDCYADLKTSVLDALLEMARTSQGLASVSGQLSDAAGQTSQAVEQVVQAIQQVATGAQDQASNAAVASASAVQMASQVDQVAASAQAAAATTAEARTSAQQGASAVQQTLTGMGEIKAVVSDAAGKVAELGKLGKKIGAIIATIDDIAEQTNLLALNAAIEAARAGEHGKGFAVVADAVQKLAEQAQGETREIAELVQAVQEGTQEAVAAMEQGAAKVERGSEQADRAGQALQEILEAVERTVGQVQEIASAAREMATRSLEVTGPIEGVAAVAEENSAAAEQVSASSEQMSAQIEEISAQAEQLADAAARLEEVAGNFKLAAHLEQDELPDEAVRPMARPAGRRRAA